jgi:RNA polymerase sigma-70 factor (ECF subfamily)
VFEEDRQLARRVLDGDEQGFRVFFDRYAPLLVGFVLRRSGSGFAAAEDVVQDVMIKAMRSLPQYRAEASLYTWLCQICRSEMADSRRRDARRPVALSMDADGSAAAAVYNLPAPVELQGGADEGVLQVLKGLPEHHARILEMKYGDEQSVEEIARNLGITVTAAQSLLARARNGFREDWLTKQADQEQT